MAVALRHRLFTVEEYHRMFETGILSADDRVELLAGEIVEMPPIGFYHAGTVDRIAYVLMSRLGARAIVRVQNPIRISVESEPHPDVSLLRPRPDFYTESPSEPSDVYLVIEVMDTSVERDRRVKLPLYARAAIPEVWLVNLPAACIEVCRTPRPDGYAEARTLHRGDPLTIAAFPDVTLRVEDILG